MTEDKPRIEINAVQVIGGALAASSAAVASSLLGVAGTVIGAAVASIVATVAGAMYTHSMRRGREALEKARTTHLTHLARLPARKSKPGSEPVTKPMSGLGPRPESATSKHAERDDTATPADTSAERAGDGEPDDGEPARTGWRERFRSLNGRKVAITAACTLLLAFGVITGVEALMGRPISAALGIDGAERGTSIGVLTETGHRPTPANSPTPGGTSTATPTGTTGGTSTPASTPTTSPPRTSAPATSNPVGTHAPTQEPTQEPATSEPPPPPMHTAPDGGEAP